MSTRAVLTLLVGESSADESSISPILDAKSSVSIYALNVSGMTNLACETVCEVCWCGTLASADGS